MIRSLGTPKTSQRMGSWLLIGLGILSPNLAAQETPEPELAEPVFTETQRVTAADVLVGFDRTAMGEWVSGGEAPRKLTTEDFVVRFDDRELPVVALTRDDEAEPWHWLVWVDAELANPEAVRWALSLLGTRAKALAARGTVEVVVADPLPVQRLAPSNDAAEIDRVLADLALHPPGSDAILTLRDDFLRELEADPADDDLAADRHALLQTPGLAGILADEERHILQGRHDLLLEHLSERSAPGPRKALLLVTGGFDRDPETFYTELLEPAAGEPSDVRDPRVESGHTVTGRTLAAYGWTPILLLPREPELLVRGWRIGKLLIRPVGPYMPPPHPQDDEQTQAFGLRDVLRRVGQVFLFGVHAKVEERRDPDKADAYLELAEALRGQGEIVDAGESYEKALYHFANDPRTAEDQARAYAGLGEMLAAQGNLEHARGAFEAALTLEPDLAERVGASVAFEEPTAGWEEWVQIGQGALVRDRVGFDRALDALGGRWRLTFQLEGIEPGTLAPLAVELVDRPPRVTHPAWARAGTPETVTEARLRQLLASHSVDPDRDEGLRVELDTRDGALWLTTPGAEAAEATTSTNLATLRVSILAESESGRALEHQVLLRDQVAAGAPLTLPALTAPIQRLAVVVENLVSGAWGAAVVDLD